MSHSIEHSMFYHRSKNQLDIRRIRDLLYDLVKSDLGLRRNFEVVVVRQLPGFL